MSFKQNLKQKIEIDRLTRQVLASLTPTESGTQIDKTAMRQLLDKAGYQKRIERDTEMLSRDFNADLPEIIVLDAELPLYRTNPADVVMRKNPVLKEMLSFRNAMRILNDKDVVVSRKTNTLMMVHGQCVHELDLDYSRKDISALGRQGTAGLETAAPGDVVESLELFAELLDLRPAPGSAKLPEIWICGQRGVDRNEASVFGNPLIVFFPSENRLNLFHTAVAGTGRTSKKAIEDMLAKGGKADLEDKAVFDWLVDQVMEHPPVHKPIDSFSP
ncbi:MAG: hypothetical protein KFF46_11395 [Desulfobacterales bacterium]|nr:hypothetical protein [Desulfobacterales bacterium]